jgi:LysM repeat protein
MKQMLLAASVAALVSAGAARAEEQANDRPAGATATAPARSVEQEIAYLRELIAAQTLRLDEAEQALKKQSAVIESQQVKIAHLEAALQAAPLARQAASARSSVYVVKTGDSLSRIARVQGVPMSALASANNLRSPYVIRTGQRLRIPGAAAPGEAPPPVAPTQSAPAAFASVAPTKQTAQPEPVAPTRVAASDPGPTPGERPEVTGRVLQDQRRSNEQPSGALPTEVGVRPRDEGARPTIAALPDVGGILTPKGSFFVEPSVDYTVTSDNRFFFQGVEIVDAILIGQIEATDIDRRAKTAGLGLRYGLTDRLEIDGRFSYIERNDRTEGVSIDDATNVLRELDGSGIGDAEIGLHYQLNNGRNWPYTIVNLRAKAPTGKGPFDVDRTDKGAETELATGSGFWTIEPSFTFILPSDPAVIFGNVGYQVNLKATPNELIGEKTTIVEFDPGEAIRASVGVGLSVNERMSLSFGYDQTNFFKSKSLVVGPVGNQEGVLQSLANPSSVVGAFTFGASYTVNDRLRLNFNTAIGATDEAPDIRAALRAQIRLFD